MKLVRSPLTVLMAVWVFGFLAIRLTAQGSRAAAWWPAAGIAVAAVACTTGRRRIAVLGGVAAGSLLANLTAGRPPLLSLCFAGANTAEAAVAGLVLARDGRPVLDSVGGLLRLVAAAAAGAAVVGPAALVVLAATNGGVVVPQAAFTVAASHATAVLLLVPPVMAVPPRPPGVGRAEAVLLWAALVLCTVAVFGSTVLLPLSFLPAAVLVWTGLRLGVRNAAWQLVVVGLLVALLSAAGLGPFASLPALPDPPSPRVTEALVQLFLGCCALVVLALAVTAAQRETALAALARQLRFDHAVLTASPDMIYVVDAGTHRVSWSSRSLRELLAPAPALPAAPDMGGAGLAALVHPDDVAALDAADLAAGALADGEVGKVRLRVRVDDGRERCLSRRVTPFARAVDGRVVELLGVARDVTDNVEFEERLAAAALHDPLTGLPNRALLVARLDAALRRTPDARVAVLFCDLDGFKRVNDTAGHAAGDAVLRVTARRLRGVLGPDDTVARVGGDEFVAVLGPGGGREDARATAGRIVTAVGEPVPVDGVVHVVTVSVGVAFAAAGDDPERALRDADRAMYHAKGRGKGRHQVLDEDGGSARAGVR